MKHMLKYVKYINLSYIKFIIAAILLFGFIFPSGYLVDLICGTYPTWPEFMEMYKLEYHNLVKQLLPKP